MSEQPVRLVILDRDGVINEDSDAFVKSADEWRPLPGSIDAIARLSQAGFTVAVATNQSGLARGLFDRDALHAMHDKLRSLVEAAGGHVDRIAHCPHGPDDDCDCRKPKPGLYVQLAEHYDVSLVDVPVIGDSRRDLEAAVAVGARPILVRTGKGYSTESELKGFSDGNPGDSTESELKGISHDNPGDSTDQELSGVDVFDNLSAAVDSLLADS